MNKGCANEPTKRTGPNTGDEEAGRYCRRAFKRLSAHSHHRSNGAGMDQ